MNRILGSGLWVAATVSLACGSIGCRKMATDDDQEQIADSVGEAMASLDESVQGAPAAALVPPVPMLRTPAELRAPWWRRALDGVSPTAEAAACWPSTFSACTGGTRTRTFDSCTLGIATLDGAVTLSFTRNALCIVATAGDAVTRNADFTLTGPFGGTLAVSSANGGQTLTKTATGFEYTVQGMKRVLTGPGGHTLFDVSTRTTSPIVITGSSRADLVIVSGTLEVSHNLAGYKVSLTPQNLAWSSNCNCAVSGSLTGTIAGGRLDGKSATVALTGCGQADLTIDGDSQNVILDRCGTI